VVHKIPCLTTVAAALAAAAGIAESRTTAVTVRSLQEYHRDGQMRLGV
jgi:carbamoyl-phosphate synthase large subunit